MEKKLIARNISGMVEQLGEGQVRAVYMVVKELYELTNAQNYFTSKDFHGQVKTDDNRAKTSKER